MERLWLRDRLLAGCRVVIRATEWLLWDVCCWMYRRAMGLAIGRDNGDGNAVSSSPTTSSPPPSPSQGKTSASPSRGRDPRRRDDGDDEDAMWCESEVCRYCYAMEKTLLWEDFTFLVNLYLIIILNATFW